MSDNKDRIILHCDLNNFYASVECHDHPEFFGKPLAVCGDIEKRHGIVLAKNEIAKKCGIYTGETVGAAKSKCSDLVIVTPHFKRYEFFSREARRIYGQYTDLIEPFGIDECWLDVTGSTKLFGNGEEIANKIRCHIKSKLGLTISVGVSFCKIFAKLGSDLKKPDAVSVIDKYNYKQILYGMNVEALLGIGKSTLDKLHSLGIFTIGDMAKSDRAAVRYRLGKNGDDLWRFANGGDCSEVKNCNFSYTPKSIGRSTTLPKDVTKYEDAKRIIYSLGEEVGYELRRQNLMAAGVTLHVKTCTFKIFEYSARMASPTQSTDEIVKAGLNLLYTNCTFDVPLRSLGIRAVNIEPNSYQHQFSLFSDEKKQIKHEQIEKSVDDIREKLGKSSVVRAINLNDKKSTFYDQSKKTLGGGLSVLK